METELIWTQRSKQEIFKRRMAVCFSLCLFLSASFIFLNSAKEESQKKVSFLPALNLNGYSRLQLNDSVSHLLLFESSAEKISVLSQIISQETGFKLGRTKSYFHKSSTQASETMNLVIAEVIDLDRTSFYAFFMNNFNLRSAHRITLTSDNQLHFEFGSLKKYSDQLAQNREVSDSVRFF